MESAKPSFLQQLGAISGNTFREAVRDRILYNLVVFVLLITAAAIFLGELTAGQEGRVIVNLGLTAILIFGTFIAIFVGVSIVWKEIEKRTVYAIFSKPVGRSTFLIGKYLGLCLTLIVNLAIMTLGVVLALVYVGSSGLITAVVASAALIAMELTIVTAVAVTFSSFSTPALSARCSLFSSFSLATSLPRFSNSLAASGRAWLSAYSRPFTFCCRILHLSASSHRAPTVRLPRWRCSRSRPPMRYFLT